MCQYYKEIANSLLIINNEIMTGKELLRGCRIMYREVVEGEIRFD